MRTRNKAVLLEPGEVLRNNGRDVAQVRTRCIKRFSSPMTGKCDHGVFPFQPVYDSGVGNNIGSFKRCSAKAALVA